MDMGGDKSHHCNKLTDEQIQAILNANPQNMTHLDPNPVKKRKIVVKERSDLTPEELASLTPVRFLYGELGFYQRIMNPVKKSPKPNPKK